jgi:uncharacterized iron-regulated protein
MRLTMWIAASLAFVCFAVIQEVALADNGFVIFAGKEPRSFESMMEELAKADVVFVGEEHDHARGHELELQILQGMQSRVPSLALSLEMFERDVQLVLDEYLSGQITEQHFLLASRPWPNYKTDYRPLVEFCKEKNLPVIAANAPRRYVNIVSRRGQAALRDLSRTARSFLAPLPYAMDIPTGYDEMLTKLFEGQHNPGGQGQPPPSMAMPSTANMKEAQGLWDATMADSILRFLKAHRGARVVQINGAGHSDSGWGIVDRLRRKASRLKVAIVSIKPDPAFPNLPDDKYDGVADFLILTPAGK